MAHSIAGMMNMNMFGIPHIGADVCGFFGEKKDDEMCGRWIQLATFYPLARTHQNLTWKDGPSEFSEPYLLEGRYKDWARDSIRDRYRYLRQLYTCLYEISEDGGSCIDPLFYHFPADENTYHNVSQTFMFGNNIKVSPVLEELGPDAVSFKSYFPKGTWVSLTDYSSIVESKGEMIELSATKSTVHSHAKPGSVVIVQNNKVENGDYVNTTVDLMKQSITVLVNRDEHGKASGSLLLDEGISRSELTNSEFEYYSISHSAQSLHLELTAGQYGQ